MKQTVVFSLLLCGLASFFACGNSTPASNTGIIYPHRALISNLTGSRVDVADTTRDLLVSAVAADLPGRLLVSSDKKFTLALSPIDNSVNVIVNSTQTAVGSSSLSGFSEGLVFTVADSLILGAVATEAGPVGQAPGAVDVITVTSTITATGTSTSLARQPSIFLPGARYLATTPNTNLILVMSDLASNPANGGGPTGRVWVLKTSLINSNTQPYEEIASSFWDHPVFAIGSADNSFMYVLNCGKECGGTQASVVKVDLTVDPPVPVAQLPLAAGATTALFSASGSTLFVAGSDPVGAVCGSSPFPSPCGGLTAIDLTSFTSTTPIPIAGGYHQRMTLGANNSLFVGGKQCTVVRDADPTKSIGCLSLVNALDLTQQAKSEPPTPFTAPAPDPGDDVTGMVPILNRNEVYVIQGGELVIYDTTTGKPKVFTSTEAPNIVGQGVDVVAVDF